MRYLMLLVCLASFTSAYAYNEMVSAIAYNPSRLGAYSYLKVLNKAKFKAGLGTTGNLTEINLYGGNTTTPITITDSTNMANSNIPHKINVIKPLSNYVVSGSDQTFYDKSSLWVYNQYAKGGTNGPQLQFSNAWLTGEQTNLATLWSAYTSAAEDTIPSVNLISTATMYGGTLTAVSTGNKKGVSVIKAIKGLDLSSSAPQEKTLIDTGMPLDFITINAANATVTSANGKKLYVDDTLTLGGVYIAASSLVCTSGSPTYYWTERMTDNHVKYHVLSRKCH